MWPIVVRYTEHQTLAQFVKEVFDMALKVIVFGAAGNVGTVAVESALHAGHEVTAFIHQTPLPEHLTDKVTAVKGDVYNTDEVSSAIQGCDGVLVALGKGSDFSATTLFSDGTRNIVAGMKEHGVRRIVICNSSFIFYERIPLMFRLLGLEPIAEDHKRQLAVLRESADELDWIVVCPPRITGAAFTGAYEVVEDHAPSSNKCSKFHVADLMVKCLSGDDHLQKCIGCGDSEGCSIS